MWYEEDDLNFKEPIYAKEKSGNEEYILLPQVKKGSYVIIGYNWFNMVDGSYNSCSFFDTAQEAVNQYKITYNIYNK